MTKSSLLDFSSAEESAGYKPFHRLVEKTPIRATCFHPDGEVYIVASNSKKLWICQYPSKEEFEEGQNKIEPPTILFQFIRPHQGSIYCATFNSRGNLFATGSNDQTVQLVQFNSEKNIPVGSEYKLTMHNGTVRDLCFMQNGEDHAQGGENRFTSSAQRAPYSGRVSPLLSVPTSDRLISAGAGDCQIYLTDCSNMKSRQVFRGHDSVIMSVHQWGNANLFVSGSLDGSIRLWDLRTRHAFMIQEAKSALASGEKLNLTQSKSERQLGDGVGVVRVESSGRLLVSGHQDGRCIVHDLRGGKQLQQMKLHEDEIRTVNFSPNSYYLLTGGYDGRIKLLDLQGDLTKRLPSAEIAKLSDKVVQTAWHPSDYNFVTTSANGTATLWTIPDLSANKSCII